MPAKSNTGPVSAFANVRMSPRHPQSPDDPYGDPEDDGFAPRKLSPPLGGRVRDDRLDDRDDPYGDSAPRRVPQRVVSHSDDLIDRRELVRGSALDPEEYRRDATLLQRASSQRLHGRDPLDDGRDPRGVVERRAVYSSDRIDERAQAPLRFTGVDDRSREIERERLPRDPRLDREPLLSREGLERPIRRDLDTWAERGPREPLDPRLEARAQREALLHREAVLDRGAYQEREPLDDRRLQRDSWPDRQLREPETLLSRATHTEPAARAPERELLVERVLPRREHPAKEVGKSLFSEDTEGLVTRQDADVPPAAPAEVAVGQSSRDMTREPRIERVGGKAVESARGPEARRVVKKRLREEGDDEEAAAPGAVEERKRKRVAEEEKERPAPEPVRSLDDSALLLRERAAPPREVFASRSRSMGRPVDPHVALEARDRARRLDTLPDVRDEDIRPLPARTPVGQLLRSPSEFRSVAPLEDDRILRRPAATRAEYAFDDEIEQRRLWRERELERSRLPSRDELLLRERQQYGREPLRDAYEREPPRDVEPPSRHKPIVWDGKEAPRSATRPVQTSKAPLDAPKPFAFSDVLARKPDPPAASEAPKPTDNRRVEPLDASRLSPRVSKSPEPQDDPQRSVRGRGAARAPEPLSPARRSPTEEEARAPFPPVAPAAEPEAPAAEASALTLPPALDSLPSGWRECIDRHTLQIYFLDHKRARITQENPWDAEVRATQEGPPTDTELLQPLRDCRDGPADSLAGAMRTRLSVPNATVVAFRRLDAEDVRSVLRALVSIRQHYLFHDTPARRQDFRVEAEVQVLVARPLDVALAMTVRKFPFTDACRQRYAALRFARDLPSATTSMQITDSTDVSEAAQLVCKQIPGLDTVQLWAADRADLLERAVHVIAEASALHGVAHPGAPALQFAAYKRCQTDPPVYEFEVSRHESEPKPPQEDL